MTESERLKLRCSNHHTFLHYDQDGIYLKCRHCKSVELKSWEELQRMYQETQQTSTSEQRVLY